MIGEGPGKLKGSTIPAYIQIELPSLNEYPQPEWNTEKSVSNALARTVNATDKSESDHAYDDLLFAVGNSHAGTYFPVVLPVIPVLGQIMQSEDSWASFTVLEALIDIYGSFEPEPQYEEFAGQSLQVLVRSAVSQLTAVVVAIGNKEGAEAESARNLLEVMSNK